MARRIARRARAHGHFESGREIWVFCPLCRFRVVGERYVHHSVTVELDRVMIEHLESDCPRANADLP